MNLTREEISQIVELAVIKAIQPIATKVEAHEMTLYGKTGNNGLRGNLRQVQRFMWIAIGGIGVIGSTIFYEFFIRKG